MDASTKVKVSFGSIAKYNEALAADIRNFTQSQQPSLPSGQDNLDEEYESQLKVLLERLYVLICDFGQYRGNAAIPDKKIITCWESFLVPIGALSEVKPHGHIMAARMILYLAGAFLGNGQLSHKLPFDMTSATPVSLRCNFLIAMDDALLSQLTQIWSHSDKREMFSWVLSEYVLSDCRTPFCCQEYLQPGQTLEDLHERRKTDRFKAACVTRPCDLTPANGVQGRWRWKRPQGDTTTAYRREPTCYSWGDDPSRTQDGIPLLMWQDLGSDGPIRDQYHYILVDEDWRESHWRNRPALRRSRQFVLDARKLATVNLSKDRRCLAVIALARSPLPVELESEVLSYLEVPEHDPYLSKLDLSVVYRPFPDITTKCAKCSRPQKTIIIWNLPLRMFHKFHLDSSDEWVLCLLDDCSKHHHSGVWNQFSRDEKLEKYLDECLQRRCGPGTTLKSMGLGPLDPVELPTAREDDERKDRLFCEKNYQSVERSDKLEEAHWIGINGLADVMLHGRTLVGYHQSGRTTTDARWMLGRTRQDEQRVISGLKKNHDRERCSYC